VIAPVYLSEAPLPQAPHLVVGVRVRVVAGVRVGREGVVAGFRVDRALGLAHPFPVVVRFRPGVHGNHAPGELALVVVPAVIAPDPAPAPAPVEVASPGDGRFTVPSPREWLLGEDPQHQARHLEHLEQLADAVGQWHRGWLGDGDLHASFIEFDGYRLPRAPAPALVGPP
jgi:hypothetical protein